MISTKRDLCGADWRRFLLALDPDRRRAAACYRALRQRLIEVFERRGLSAPDDLADEVIERVVRRCADGDVEHVAAYALGVGNWVAAEHRRRERRRVAIDEQQLPDARSDAVDPETATRLDLLERELRELPDEAGSLLLRYHAGARRDPDHRGLAHELGIGVNALRIRVHRLRRRLRASIELATQAAAG